MDKQEQTYAILIFENWLKKWHDCKDHSMEIAESKVLTCGTDEVVFVKYKLQDSSYYMYGIIGLQKFETSYVAKFIWSDYKEYHEKAEEICVQEAFRLLAYDKEVKEALQTVYSLNEEGKWEEIVKYVNENIHKFKQPREINGERCLQLPWADILFYKTNSQKSARWVDDTESKLLWSKIVALIQLEKFMEVEICLDQIVVLQDKCFEYYLFLFNYWVTRGKIAALPSLLKNLHYLAWREKNFAQYLLCRALFFCFAKNPEQSINNLSLSFLYDSSEAHKFAVDKMLRTVRAISPDFDGSLVEPTDTEKLLKLQEGMVKPSENCKRFAIDIYKYVLSHQISTEILAYGQTCNIMAGSIAVRGAEISVLTFDQQIANEVLGFAFQISKKFTVTQNNTETTKFSYTLTDENNHTIDVYYESEFTNEDSFYKTIQTAKQNLLKNNFTIVEEKNFVGKNGLNGYKVYIKNAQEEFLYCWFQATSSTIACAKARILKRNGFIESEIEKVINYWYLTNGQKVKQRVKDSLVLNKNNEWEARIKNTYPNFSMTVVADLTDDVLAYMQEFVDHFETYYKRIKSHELQELVELKNETWLQQDESPITKEELYKKLKLYGVSVYDDSMELFFDVDGLFGDEEPYIEIDRNYKPDTWVI